MHSFFQYFINKQGYVIAFLAIMLAMPCWAKRELKQKLNIELHQSNKSNTAKTNCTSVCSLQIVKSAKTQKLVSKKELRSFCHKNTFTSYSHLSSFLKKDIYQLLKEKIPTRILLHQYLI